MAWADPHGSTAGSVIDVLVATARELDATPAQVALAWLRHRPVHVVPILGATSTVQLSENLASVELDLEPEVVARLDDVSAVPLGYPHHYLESPMARSFRAGGMSERIGRWVPR